MVSITWKVWECGFSSNKGSAVEPGSGHSGLCGGAEDRGSKESRVHDVCEGQWCGSWMV